VALALLAAMFIYWLIFRTTLVLRCAPSVKTRKLPAGAGINVRGDWDDDDCRRPGRLSQTIETLGLNHVCAGLRGGLPDGIIVVLLG
jgi:hypothetical protein